ncbi:copper resistance protein CopC [Herbiconiux sp. CPCC 205716]|uniref:Copper resistance protein CopC n=1 Tax=Herbiconiux gentiana TaxID=2970912 RepID=A0ABT2GGB7_9MICO|nr:copper resistance CopC family protein [Herbiconiux gentiana]MCS5715267.1 copper resistance protein CopC [Herbiconiux gentiana]
MSRTHRPLTLLAATAFAGTALVWAGFGGAVAAVSAHDVLASAAPGDGDSITADPGSVVLGFSDELLLQPGGTTDGFAVQIVDSEGLHYESGCVTLDGTSVSAPIALGGAGGYQVLWQVVSSDGHPTSGQYGFDYEPPSLEGAHDGLTNAPTCGAPWAGEPDGTPVATTPATGSAPVGAAPVEPAPATDAPADAEAPTTLQATETAGPVSGELQQPGALLPWPVIVLIVLAGLGAIAAIVVLTLRRSRGGGFGGS